jgi:hypothetical protein
MRERVSKGEEEKEKECGEKKREKRERKRETEKQRRREGGREGGREGLAHLASCWSCGEMRPLPLGDRTSTWRRRRDGDGRREREGEREREKDRGIEVIGKGGKSTLFLSLSFFLSHALPRTLLLCPPPSLPPPHTLSFHLSISLSLSLLTCSSRRHAPSVMARGHVTKAAEGEKR